MKNKIIPKILTMFLIIMIISSIHIAIQATITPADMTGTDDDWDMSFLENITDDLQVIGSFVAVGALMIIGIKYAMGSLEEKAQYKKSMMPFVIGCFILFGAANLAPRIQELAEGIDGSSYETTGNTILGIIQTVGIIAIVGILMVLGIKYMVGSTDERAEYKKTMIPYLIGVVLIASAVGITSVIYNISQDVSSATGTAMNAETGISDGNSYLKEVTASYKVKSASGQQAVIDEIEDKIAYAKVQQSKYISTSDEYKYWTAYLAILQTYETYIDNL